MHLLISFQQVYEFTSRDIPMKHRLNRKLVQAWQSRKRKLKKNLAWAWQATNFFGRHDQRLPILSYHSVNNDPNRGYNSLSPALFEEHLAYLTTNHRVVPLREVAEALLHDKALPANSVALTFDDGLRDTFEVVFPLLNYYQAHATVFVVTGFLDGEVNFPEDPCWKPMTWAQAQEMDASLLVEIAAHTHTHARLSKLDHMEVVREVEKSKAMLEEKLQRPVDLFAYPYGQGADIPLSAVAAVERLGFVGACSTFWRTTHKPRERLLINRVTINRDDTVEDLKRILAGDYDYMFYVQKSKAFYSSTVHGKGLWH